MIMGYLVRKRQLRKVARSRGRRPALGGFLDTLTADISTASAITSDPYLPETICHVNQLKAIKAGGTPGDCAQTQAGLPGGIGLEAAQTPLRFYVYAKQHAWVFPVVGALVFAAPFMLGYWVAKGGK